MEHSIHVAGGHFIKGISPTPSRSAAQKTKDKEVDVGEDGEDGTEFEAGDTIGKALALVTQASSLSITKGLISNVALIDSEVTTGTRVFSPSV
jgi:hypothetical protein